MPTQNETAQSLTTHKPRFLSPKLAHFHPALEGKKKSPTRPPFSKVINPPTRP